MELCLLLRIEFDWLPAFGELMKATCCPLVAEFLLGADLILGNHLALLILLAECNEVPSSIIYKTQTRDSYRNVINNAKPNAGMDK